MQAYYISGSNVFSIRTKPTGSGVLTLSLQNMYTLANTTSSISSYTYKAYESLLEFTASISSSNIGDEYRATILDSVSGSIWNGSIQVYQSQSIDKPVYRTQIPIEGIYISNVTDNEYIILD
jgi:hypothetical protein